MILDIILTLGLCLIAFQLNGIMQVLVHIHNRLSEANHD